MSEITSMASMSEMAQNDVTSLSITEISDLKASVLSESAMTGISTSATSVKSRILEINKSGSQHFSVDDKSEDFVLGESMSEISARRPSEVAKSPGTKQLTPAVDSGPFSNESFNHRAIEVVPPLPLKTFGRKAPVESKPEVDGEHINNNPLNVLLQDDQYANMSNEAVMDALRSMATQSLQRAADKSANDELFASMKKAQEEELEQENHPSLPEISIIQPSLVLERQIQVHDEVITERDEQKIVQVKTANINFEVEEMDPRELKPDLGLPDVFPEVTEAEKAQFDVSKLNRTMTMGSRRKLISTESAAKIDELEKGAKLKSKKTKKPPKMSYRYPGCCVSILRVLLSFCNLLTLLAGIACIILGIYGQIKFRFGVESNDTLAVATDPTFILLIIGLIIMVVSFNGAFGFFRGNTIMLKFFGWILVLIFLGLFVGGIVVFAMAGDVKVLFDQTFKHFMTMSANGHKSAEILVDYIQSSFDCCGSMVSGDYKSASIGYCNAKEAHDDTCRPPDSCCPADITCTMTDAREEGCIRKLEITFDSNTGLFCGIWIGIWFYMLIQLASVRHTVRRIELSRQWHVAFGHIEEEEKLRARIAKKEKALTQIEMDIHVQDIG